LQRSRLHIGGDSGVLHLAMALGTPTLSMVGEHAGLKEWMPVGERHRQLTAGCLASISAAQVTAVALRQLQ
jgi:ADP-heptose:LPS heptosyltransferase